MRIVTTAIAAGLLVLTLIELEERYTSSALVIHADPTVLAEDFAHRQRWMEARWLAEFVVDHPDLGDAERAAELVQTAQRRLEGLGLHAARFAEGALTGEPDDFAGLMGSLSLDLFVVGDIRDIAVQSWKQVHYGTGDEIVLALSSIGLATTLLPEFDWAPALLKWLVKSKAVNPRMLATIRNLSRQALQTGDFRGLTALMENVGKAGLRLGPGPLRGALVAVDTVEDLATLAAGAKVNARDTYVLTALFGNKGIRRMRNHEGNVVQIVSGIKRASRAVKIAKKTLGAVPLPWMLCLIALSTAMLWWSLRPRRRRVSRNRKRIEPLLNTAAGRLSADSFRCPLEADWRLRR